MPRARRHLLTLTGLILLGGCIVPVPKGHNPLALRFMSQENLRSYSEAVFRRHNQATTRLMMAPLEVESLSSAALTRLENAEQRMNEACSSLNAVASARASDTDTGLALENEVRQTVRVCDAATQRVEALLDEFGVSR